MALSSPGAFQGALRRRLAFLVWITAGAAALGAGATPAAGQAASEYQLKAVFLFRFAQFAEWPEGTFASPDAPLVIGVLGDDPFGAALDETVRGETVNGHPLTVRRYRRGDETADCHILFVNYPSERQLASALDRLGERPILTVGDAEQFAGRGGMIQFVTARHRIQLHVNLEAVEAAGLTLSSKLLRPATIVATRKE